MGAHMRTVRSRRLALELRHFREQAGLTGEQVAEEMGWSLAKVYRIEGDKGRILVRDVQRLLKLYQWLPGRLAGQVTRQALHERPMFEVLASAGVAMGRVRQEITAEMADPSRAGLLGTAIGAALLRINRTIYGRDGEPVQAQSLFLSPERSHILMDVPAEHLDTAASGVVAHDLPRP